MSQPHNPPHNQHGSLGSFSTTSHPGHQAPVDQYRREGTHELQSIGNLDTLQEKNRARDIKVSIAGKTLTDQLGKFRSSANSGDRSQEHMTFSSRTNPDDVDVVYDPSISLADSGNLFTTYKNPTSFADSGGFFTTYDNPASLVDSGDLSNSYNLPQSVSGSGIRKTAYYNLTSFPHSGLFLATQDHLTSIADRGIPTGFANRGIPEPSYNELTSLAHHDRLLTRRNPSPSILDSRFHPAANSANRLGTVLKDLESKLVEATSRGLSLGQVRDVVGRAIDHATREQNETEERTPGMHGMEGSSNAGIRRIEKMEKSVETLQQEIVHLREENAELKRSFDHHVRSMASQARPIISDPPQSQARDSSRLTTGLLALNPRPNQLDRGAQALDHTHKPRRRMAQISTSFNLRSDSLTTTEDEAHDSVSSVREVPTRLSAEDSSTGRASTNKGRAVGGVLPSCTRLSRISPSSPSLCTSVQVLIPPYGQRKRKVNDTNDRNTKRHRSAVVSFPEGACNIAMRHLSDGTVLSSPANILKPYINEQLAAWESTIALYEEKEKTLDPSIYLIQKLKKKATKPTGEHSACMDCESRRTLCIRVVKPGYFSVLPLRKAAREGEQGEESYWRMSDEDDGSQR